MKITIDTKEDSHEDLRKVMSLLSGVLGEKQSSNVFENSSEMPSLMSMFDASPQVSEKKEAIPTISVLKKPSVELY